MKNKSSNIMWWIWDKVVAFSRQSLPKPFISINGEKSLLDLTLERINLVPNLGEITIVGNQRHSFF